MRPLFNLDARLALCAEFVRKGVAVADIGTDHAYLPVWLCKSGKTPRAIACDLRPEPLAAGVQIINKYSAQEQVCARLGNGLSAVAPNEVQDIVIAGMGGELIAQIIANAPWVKNGDIQLILQPMTKGEALIGFLLENGFELLRRDCTSENGKTYSALLCRYDGRRRSYLPEDTYAALLKPKCNAEHRAFLQNEIARLKKKGLGDEQHLKTAEKLEELL